ncbi:MAG: hypothetical protein E7266_10715 [Lachnospiraceae bacterium]|nr:hypothetical protein [Lachnospiraceae bacterium]
MPNKISQEKINKKSQKHNKARIEVLYEKAFEGMGKIARLKAFKICLIIVIIVGATIGINFAYWKMCELPTEIYGVWYEYEENLTVEQYEADDFEIKKLGISSNNTIQYLKNPSKGEKSVDLLIGNNRHQGSDFGKLLMPYGTYTFQFPSFAVHKLSDYKVENGVLYITIDGVKHTFYNNSSDVTAKYVKNFYGIENIYEYYYGFLKELGAEEISYGYFMELLENKDKDTCVVMFSELVDYENIAAYKDEFENLVKTSGKKWCFVSGKNISDEDSWLVMGSPIADYLGLEFTGIIVDTLKEPVVIVLDGSINPEDYRVNIEFEELRKNLEK